MTSTSTSTDCASGSTQRMAGQGINVLRGLLREQGLLLPAGVGAISKRGDVDLGGVHIRAARTPRPRFALSHRPPSFSRAAATYV
jgi:hypothetical protein